MQDRIVVTGAAGFIGRNIVAELNRRGHTNLLLCDLLSNDDKWKNLRGLFFEDLIAPEALLEASEAGKLNDVRAIVHMGACSSTTERNADYLLANNYHYTRRLGEFALAHGVRFVYASSAATYGDGSLGYDDDDQVTPRLRPLNMYGYSKQLFDLWALSTGAIRQIAGLKYFNVFGPYEDHKGDMKSVVAKSYAQIIAGESVKLFRSYRPEYADGEQKRDFVYVKDAVDATLWLMDQHAVNGVFNCGTGKARSWKDLAAAVYRAMALPERIEFIEMPEALRGKYQYFTEAKMDKLRAAGYTAPFHSLEEGVDDYVKSYLGVKQD